MKITITLILFQCRSHSDKNPCKTIKNKAMDDPDNKMEKKIVKVKNYFEMILSAQFLTRLCSQRLGPEEEPEA